MHARVRRAPCALLLFSMSLALAPTARGDELPPLTASGSATLERAALVRAVLARNPSAAVAEAAVRAADARAEGAGAFADPRVRYQLAPRSLWDGPRSGHRIELAQPIARWGKRGLARSAARGDAQAAGFELGALRLDLALAASQLYDDLYLAGRSLAVNAAHRELIEELRAAALARYETGQAPQYAALAAELEAARLEHREIELRAMQRIATAQLNALLHRAPEAKLPAPGTLAAPPRTLLDLPPSDARPELRAAAARAEARDAELRLARRERIPDVTLMAGYDGMWDAPEMRPMVGVELELPLQRAHRRARVAEADALLAAAASERERAESDAALAVAIARERFAEAHHALGIVRDQMLPAAHDRAEAANAAFAAGRAEFGDAIDAERAWYETELAGEEALVNASRRAAELLRALGVSAAEELR